MTDAAAAGPDLPALSIACLCAAWCRTCEGYRPVLDQVAGEFAARGLAAPRWIDVEDEEALLGDVEVETFPTVVVFDRRRVLFAGPVVPRAEHLQRLLSIVIDTGDPAGPVAPEWEDLVARLRVSVGDA